MRTFAVVSSAAAITLAVACGGGSLGNGFTHGPDDGDGGTTMTPSDAAGSSDVPVFTPTDAAHPQDSGGGAPVSVVYAHSANTLYKLDPATEAVSVIGNFKGCSSVIDIAVDASSNAYVTTTSNFYKLDLATAQCTHIASGSYPNSLSFIPKGTLDPGAEALVGYFGSQYVRIDPATGAVTTIGALTGGYASSGDIVSVIGGGTFLTVNGGGCSDCLLQINPKTGDIVQSYGSVNHGSVFGLAFWAGTVYGFDDGGEVFSISWQNNAIVTKNIPVPNPPSGLQFWGAGSTTSAPPVSADGGGIPVK